MNNGDQACDPEAVPTKGTAEGVSSAMTPEMIKTINPPAKATRGKDQFQKKRFGV